MYANVLSNGCRHTLLVCTLEQEIAPVYSARFSFDILTVLVSVIFLDRRKLCVLRLLSEVIGNFSLKSNSSNSAYSTMIRALEFIGFGLQRRIEQLSCEWCRRHF